jgi:hypothetical protein
MKLGKFLENQIYFAPKVLQVTTKPQKECQIKEKTDLLNSNMLLNENNPTILEGKLEKQLEEKQLEQNQMDGESYKVEAIINYHIRKKHL